MDTFKIATYNIQFAINREKIVENIALMVKEGVMLFCLQEIVNVPNKEFIINSILKRLGKNWKAEYHVGVENSRLSIGTAILWKRDVFMLKQTKKILLPKIKRFDLHENFYYKVIGVPNIPLQRKAITCYFAYKQKIIRVTCLHLDNVGGPKHRFKQFSYLLSKLDKLKKAKREIICGDFNTFDLLKTGYEKRLLQKTLGKEFADASKDVDWTSDIYMLNFQTSITVFPWFIKTFKVHIRRRLDYIWIKQMKVLECKKLPLFGSDHLPIIAKLKIGE